MLRKILALGAVVTVILASGCASVQMAPPEQDTAAKSFAVKPGKANIYVYRNETFGAALSMPVSVNGKLAGSTGPRSYFKFDLPAGKHVITSQGEGSKLEMSTEAGKIYYVWQEVKMGMLSGGSKLQLVSEDVGRKGVTESSRIQANP
jgi:hypothetical protein